MGDSETTPSRSRPMDLSLLSENTEKNWLFKILALAEDSWIRLPLSSFSSLIALLVSLFLHLIKFQNFFLLRSPLFTMLERTDHVT